GRSTHTQGGAHDYGGSGVFLRCKGGLRLPFRNRPGEAIAYGNPGIIQLVYGAPVSDPPEPVLQLRGVSKRFAGVHALEEVDLDLAAGEVHALMGENGAGKSTLVRVLSGMHQPDAGTIRLAGEEVVLDGPAAARDRGIAV